MRMNKYKLIGTLVAALLLIASLLLRGSGEGAAIFALPLLCIGVWVLVLFDTIAYRTTSSDPASKRMELMRLFALWVIAILVSVGAVLFGITKV